MQRKTVVYGPARTSLMTLSKLITSNTQNDFDICLLEALNLCPICLDRVFVSLESSNYRTLDHLIPRYGSAVVCPCVKKLIKDITLLQTKYNFLLNPRGRKHLMKHLTNIFDVEEYVMVAPVGVARK